MAEPLRILRLLAAKAPAFPAEHIIVEGSPAGLLSQLMQLTSSAKKRIVMSALYLGTGSDERALVGAIHHQMQDNSGLRVKWLLDHMRGSRGKENSRTMLRPLVTAAAHVSLYHSPLLRGWKMKLLPPPFNESVGVLHMKAFVFDDDVILSGANLSDSYFTNRQDRCIVVKNSPLLANYIESVVDTVGSFSFTLNRDGTVNPPQDMEHPITGNLERFVSEAGQRLKMLATTAAKNQDLPSDPFALSKVWVVPFLQAAPLHVRDDEQITLQLLEEMPDNSRVRIMSGYFNMTDEYIEGLLKSRASYELLCASPEANGFHGGKHVLGLVPEFYVMSLEKFYQKVLAAKRDVVNPIRLYEYMCPGWTFHGKGMWYYPDREEHTLPVMTMIGSPNYGFRSVYRDLECHLAIVTDDTNTAQALDKECSDMFHMSMQYRGLADRKISMAARIASSVGRDFF